jgi:hypothetical protein
MAARVENSNRNDSREARRTKQTDQVSLVIYRLFADTLPQDALRLRALADKFFDRISTLRCLGFIHKPTFYQALDRGTLNEDFGEAVIYIVAAFGAR